MYGTALEINPELAEAHVGRCNALFKEGRYKAAIQSMSAVAAARSDLRSGGSLRRFMGTSLRELGQVEEATEHFRQALQIESHDDMALDHLAFNHFRGKRYAQALALYEEP